MRKETEVSSNITLRVKKQTSLAMNNWKLKFLKLKYEIVGMKLTKDVQDLCNKTKKHH